MNARDIVASTQDPAFAVDAGGTILAWNRAAEQLLGYREPQALEQRCWEILSGRDVFGNDYCGEGCPLLRMARNHRPVSRCELRLRGGSGKLTHVGISTMAVPGDSPADNAIVHLLTPVASAPGCGDPVHRQLFGKESSPLTARQIQVLSLLNEGLGTTDIAERLFICAATVRNHIKNILSKLKVHSRLEAVSLARRVGLLESVRSDR